MCLEKLLSTNHQVFVDQLICQKVGWGHPVRAKQLLIKRIPLLGESHKNGTYCCLYFSGYNGRKSFNHFQFPHMYSYTQAFLHRYEDY